MHPLRVHRLDRGWSLEDLARHLIAIGNEVGEPGLGTDGRTVGRWECSERQPRAPYPKLLCLLFEASASELGIGSSPYTPPCDRLDGVERRTLLRLLAGALGAPVVGQADRVAHALRKPSGADEVVVSTVEAGIAAARRLDDVSGPRLAVEPALAQRAVVRKLLEGGPPVALQAPLTAAAAELSQLLGWLASDMNDHRTSRAYFDEALQLAREAGAESLGSYVLGHLSTLAVADDNPQEGLAFAEAARTRAEGSVSPAARSWLAMVEAEALAGVRDRSGAERALDQARTTLSRSRAEDEPPWIYYCDEAELERAVGSVYLVLGLAEPARRAMQQALATYGASMVRDRAYALARLGQTYVLDGEAEEACRLAGEALGVATDTRCDWAVVRVRRLRAELEPWASEAMVRELDDQLAATSAWCRPDTA